MTALRLLLVSFIPDTRASGMGKWSHEMASALSGLGHTVTLWFADDFPAMAALDRLSVVAFPFALTARLLRSRTRFDAIVVHEPVALPYALMRRCASSLPPLVVMCHNVESKCFHERKEAWRRGLATLPLATRVKTPLVRLVQSDTAIRLADHVVCLSTTDERYIIDRLGCQPERVTRLTNGVADDAFVGERPRDPGERALFIGGWLDVKGKRVLPKLWARVHRRRPQATLAIAGSGLTAASVLADFEPDDRDSVTVIPGLLDAAAVRATMAEHDVLVIPSLSEGCPLTLFEALAARLPVVAASVGGIPDIVEDGRHALLFDPRTPDEGATKVCAVFEERASAETRSRAAQQRARLLTWTESAQTLAKAAERAILHVGVQGGR